MPSITPAAVQKVANLSRISKNLSSEDLAKYTAELEAIPKYTSILNEL